MWTDSYAVDGFYSPINANTGFGGRQNNSIANRYDRSSLVDYVTHPVIHVDCGHSVLGAKVFNALFVFYFCGLGRIKCGRESISVRM